MKLLVLGGTVFLGRHVVEAAMKRGHEVTIFTRGFSNPDLYPDVEKLRGDRDGNLGALKGRQFDAVIDTSGYVPRIVKESLDVLADATAHYTFISSISVYKDFSQVGIDENAGLETVEDEATENIQAHYGALKALCEKAVLAALPQRALIVRPGLIVGPFDKTDRFTYWPERIARGGEVLAPGRRNRQVQLIDGRDLAEWVLTMAEKQVTGIYNATGPSKTLTMEQMLEETKAALNSNATFTWVDDEFLGKKGVGPWMELPLWIPDSGPFIDENGRMSGMLSANIDKAVAAGITFRTVGQIARDTFEWSQSRKGTERKAGMKADKEAEVLAAWHAKHASTTEGLTLGDDSP